MSDVDPRPTVLSLFSGAGGLDLAFDLLGARTVCYVENEAAAAGVLASRMASGDLDEAPIWTDVRSFDGKPWRGMVDIVAGGFPCQDASRASSTKAGIYGDRTGLWSEFARIIGECSPPIVFAENVDELVRRGFDRVLFDLAELGYDAEWSVVEAAAVGAPHHRARLFVLAYSNGKRREANRVLLDLYERQKARRGEHWGGSGGLLWPPPPDGGIESWPDLLPEPGIPGDADGVAHRLDRVRLIGNGVVPAQAALAFIGLARRALGGVDDDGRRRCKLQ